MVQADNAIIMAAGTSSRFAPLSYERPKGLMEVKGEILVEREIRQLKEAGIGDIILVTGYKRECYAYLERKFGIRLIYNPDYAVRNNNASIYAARMFLRNSFICSSDNYFSVNPFEKENSGSYYAAVYADGPTDEWCMQEDENGLITDVTIGGQNAYYMLGHAFWDEQFSRKFVKILEREYNRPETRGKLWEKIYAEHLNEFEMKVRHYPSDVIFEFDTLDELRQFDRSYIDRTRSAILEQIAGQIGCRERDITGIQAQTAGDSRAVGFVFTAGGNRYSYTYADEALRRI